MLLDAHVVSAMNKMGFNYGGDFLVRKEGKKCLYPFWVKKTMGITFYEKEDILAMVVNDSASCG